MSNSKNGAPEGVVAAVINGILVKAHGEDSIVADLPCGGQVTIQLGAGTVTAFFTSQDGDALDSASARYSDLEPE